MVVRFSRTNAAAGSISGGLSAKVFFLSWALRSLSGGVDEYGQVFKQRMRNRAEFFTQPVRIDHGKGPDRRVAGKFRGQPAFCKTCGELAVGDGNAARHIVKPVSSAHGDPVQQR